MLAFQAALRRSRIYFYAVALFYAAAAGCVWTAFGKTWLTAALWLLLAAAWVHYLHRLRSERYFISRIRIDRQGRACLKIGVKEYAAHLCSGSVVSRPLCLLKWQLEADEETGAAFGRGKILWQAVFADMTDAEAYRRLRVWAYYGQW